MQRYSVIKQDQETALRVHLALHVQHTTRSYEVFAALCLHRPAWRSDPIFVATEFLKYVDALAEEGNVAHFKLTHTRPCRLYTPSEKTSDELGISSDTGIRSMSLFSALQLKLKTEEIMSKLFLGNIPHGSSDWEVQQWIESQGFHVESVEVMYDRTTGKPRGFGFARLSNEADIPKAIVALNGRQMDGRPITVNKATPLTQRLSQTGGEGKPRVL